MKKKYLKRPFADEDRELGFLSNVLGLATDSRVDVVGVGSGSGEVVDVGIHDDVGASIVERSPEASALEAVLELERNTLVNNSNLLEDTVDVGVDPVGGVVRKTSSGTEAGEVVRSLVDRGNGEGVLVAR